MSTFRTPAKQTTRPLTHEEELEIIRWCRANPDADLNAKTSEWRTKFNCTGISVQQVFVKDWLGHYAKDLP